MSIIIALGYFLLSLAVFLLFWSLVIYVVLRIGFAVCGKSHVLTACLRKFGVRANESAYQHANYYNNGENTAYLARDFGSRGEVSYHSSSRHSSFSPPSSISSYSSPTNPASGLPTIGSSSIDSGGNVYGTRR